MQVVFAWIAALTLIVLSAVHISAVNAKKESDGNVAMAIIALIVTIGYCF